MMSVPGTKSYYTFFVGSAQGEVVRKFLQVRASRPAVSFAKSSFREISQANRESTKSSARLFFAKSSFDKYFNQKRESTPTAPKEFIFYFSKFKFFRGISGLQPCKPMVGGAAISQDSR